MKFDPSTPYSGHSRFWRRTTVAGARAMIRGTYSNFFMDTLLLEIVPHSAFFVGLLDDCFDFDYPEDRLPASVPLSLISAGWLKNTSWFRRFFFAVQKFALSSNDFM
jgi:hypothetical protein